jgi:hypothetical protein
VVDTLIRFFNIINIKQSTVELWQQKNKP